MNFQRSNTFHDNSLPFDLNVIIIRNTVAEQRVKRKHSRHQKPFYRHNWTQPKNQNKTKNSRMAHIIIRNFLRMRFNLG